MNKKSVDVVKLVIFLWVICTFLIPFLSIYAEDFAYFFEEAQWNPFDYARITDVDYTAVVVDEPDGEGKVLITERLTFDIHAASKNNTFWEIWRDLPENYVDGVKVEYNVKSVTQILEDGTRIPWEESPELYWEDSDFDSNNKILGPGKWFHSEGPYNENLRQYECLLFYIDGVYRDEMTFEIEYEMTNAALRYNDCSDLYISMHSGSPLKHYESFKAQVLIPNELMPDHDNYFVSTYGTDAYNFPVTESASLNPGYYTFIMDLDESELKFSPYNEFLEFDMVTYGEDKHIFTQNSPDNDYSDYDVLVEIIDEQQAYLDSAKEYQQNQITLLAFSIIASVIVLALTVTTKIRTKKKYNLYKPTMDITTFRDIPSDLDPAFASALTFCKHKEPKDDGAVYSAILLSLARKKYIEITDHGPNDIRITIIKQTSPLPGQQTLPGMENMNTDFYEPLTMCEEYYFNLIVRHASNNVISMRYLQYRISSDYSNTDTFVRNMEKAIPDIGIREGYLQKANYKQPYISIKGWSTFLFVMAVISLVINLTTYATPVGMAYGAFIIFSIVCIICGIYLRITARKYVLLTQFGEDEYAKWRGLYKFLNSDTLMSERTFVELPLWEKYLVYATALGLSEKVIKAISINCPEAASSVMLSNPCYRSRSFYHSSRSIRRTTRTVSSSVRSGGYGGGGYGGHGSFGYGGGGRGGGSGGGGH